MDLLSLSALLPVLRKNGVKCYRDGDLEIEMGPDMGALMDRLEPAPEPKDMPPDLKADDLMNADKVLHWSAEAPPGEGDHPMPLTGEEP